MSGPAVARPGRAFIDLHCHTRGSFNSLSDPGAVMRAAQSRGLTHLAITDHDRIDEALRARDAAPAELTIIVGSEVKTADGDLICLFLERPIAPGLPAAEAIAAARDQGGLVGIPHPFDRFRGSLLQRPAPRRPRRPGRLGRGLECPGHRPRWQRTGRRVRAPSSLAHGGRVRCSHDARDRRRVYGRRRRPVDAGRPPDGAVVRRHRPRSGILCRTGDHPAGQARPTRTRQRTGATGHRPTPRARGWSDDRRPDATLRPPTSSASRELERPRVGSEQSDGAADDQVTADQLSLGRRLRQPRTIISIVLPLVLLVLFARALPGFKVGDILGYVAAANKTAPLCGVPRLLPRLPAARPALGDPDPGDRLPAQGPRLDRDHPHLVAGQLPRAGQARRRLPGVPAQDQQPGLPEPDVRDRLHRADPRPVRDRRARPAVRVLSFRKGLPAEVQVVFAIGLIVVIVLAVGLLSMRNFGRRIIVRLPLPHQRGRAVRPVRGGRLLGDHRAAALPGLVVITGLIWTTEALRLYLVILALGFSDIQLGPAARSSSRSPARCSPPCPSRLRGSGWSRSGSSAS